MTVAPNTFKRAPRKTRRSAAPGEKKTILIYSPDLNFCFSLSTLFQDRYNVITTTNPGMLQTSVRHYPADLLIEDAPPSDAILQQLDGLRRFSKNLPIIMLYVYDPKGIQWEPRIRDCVDSVFYKPFDIALLSRRIDELLPA